MHAREFIVGLSVEFTSSARLADTAPLLEEETNIRLLALVADAANPLG
jgi:hypothetical protein